MGQTDWFIDDAGSREATGADAGHPIPEIERRFRMGATPEWNDTATGYHLRYLTDTATVVIQGRRDPASVIFIHGSATNGAGQSTTYSGNIDALTTLNRLTNTPWEITSNAIPTSWTASSLVNGRIRRVSDGMTGWAIKDLGTKKARCSEFCAPATFTVGGFTGAPGTAIGTPVAADAFVVERLTKINKLYIHVPPSQRTTNLFNGVIVDSIDVGSQGLFSSAGDYVSLIACLVQFGLGAGGFLSTAFLNGCRINQVFTPIGGGGIGITGGYTSAALLLNPTVGSSSLRRFMVQGGALNFCGVGGNDVGGWLAQIGLGAFDCASAFNIFGQQGICLNSSLGAALWGSGNTSSVSIRAGGSMMVDGPVAQATHFPIAATNDVAMGGKFSVPAFDSTTCLYTPPRTLTWPHICTEQSAGGFCQNGSPNNPFIVDPLTGAAITMRA